MSNYNQSLIEDYRQTIERLQKECTEKTNAIIALGEQLKAKEQECEQIKEKYEALKLENQEGYEIVAELKQECEKLKKQLETSEEWRIAAESLNEKLDLKNTRYRKALEEIEEYCNNVLSFTAVRTTESDILNIINKAKGRE